MFLYEKTDKTIDVYTMVPNSKKIFEYKISQMQDNIPLEEKILKAITTDEKPLEDVCLPIPLYNLQKRKSGIWGGVSFHSLITYDMTEKEKDRQLLLLNDFYKGKFSGKKVAIIQDYNKEKEAWEIIKYLLLTSSYKYDNFYNYKNYCMNDIICIPRSLYLLQMLEQGDFYKIEDEEIYEQLQLFDISSKPKDKFYINHLKRMYDNLLLPGVFEGVMMNVKTTQKILEKTRKKAI